MCSTFDQKEATINAFYKNGVKYLLGFNPWELKKVIAALEGDLIYSLLIPEYENSKGTYRQYAENWQYVLDKFFSYNPSEFPDPVDQCKYVADNVNEIIEEIFKGIETETEIKINKNTAIFQLKYYTTLYLEHLAENILEWALTHKFAYDLVEDVILDDDDTQN